jgi:hypothetical protein
LGDVRIFPSAATLSLSKADAPLSFGYITRQTEGQEV